MNDVCGDVIVDQVILRGYQPVCQLPDGHRDHVHSYTAPNGKLIRWRREFGRVTLYTDEEVLRRP